MAKMFEFCVFQDDMRETEKAWGLMYWTERGINAKYVWLPKSQINVEFFISDEYDDPDCDSAKQAYIEVPMWLARKHGYFEGTLFQTSRIY